MRALYSILRRSRYWLVAKSFENSSRLLKSDVMNPFFFSFCVSWDPKRKQQARSVGCVHKWASARGEQPRQMRTHRVSLLVNVLHAIHHPLMLWLEVRRGVLASLRRGALELLPTFGLALWELNWVRERRILC